MTNTKPLRVVVAGLGNMGRSHALAYHENPASRLRHSSTAPTWRCPRRSRATRSASSRFADVIRATKPDIASINTYSDSHADYAVMALEAGCHVFIEKPLATTVADAQARRRGRQGQRPEAGRRLHTAPPPVLDQADRRGAQVRPALRLPHEPQPAVLRPHLGHAQAAHADDLADRRLRRPLSRRDVPDHRRQAGRGARHGRAAHATRSTRPCTITAICRCCSTTVRSAGTRPAGADDVGDRLFREGRDLAKRLRLDRHERGRALG